MWEVWSAAFDQNNGTDIRLNHSDRDGESQNPIGRISIQMDMIEHRWPDIVVIEQDNKTALLIDTAVPGDTTVEEKEQKKVGKYLNLAPGTQEALESEH